jgi:quinol monooxygenase YgiN
LKEHAHGLGADKHRFLYCQGRAQRRARRAVAGSCWTSRSEPGCLRYDVYHSNDDPNTWFVYEDWRSRADFDAHMRTPYMHAFMTDLPALCVQDVDIRAYRRVSRAA